MSNADGLRRQLASIKTKDAQLARDITRAEEEASKLRSASFLKVQSAQRTTSLSTASSHLRGAQEDERRALVAEKKAAELRRKAAENNKQGVQLQSRLRSAENAERRSQDREAARRLQESNRRARSEEAHARKLRRLAGEARQDWDYLSERGDLRVLYLTANPTAIERRVTAPDGSLIEESHWLRTEAEVREVQEAVRGSRLRGMINVQHRPAATFDSLLNGLNDLTPQILHFSGHGGSGAVVLDAGKVGEDQESTLSFDQLKKVLLAVDTPPKLLVLNACDTVSQAEQFLDVVAVVIAMSATIADSAAIVFAKRFYAAIASGQTVQSAFNQAKVAMEFSSLEDAELPTLIGRDENTSKELVLIA